MQENTISSFIEARMAEQKRSHLHILLIISIIFTAILAYFFHLLKKKQQKMKIATPKISRV